MSSFLPAERLARWAFWEHRKEDSIIADEVLRALGEIRRLTAALSEAKIGRDRERLAALEAAAGVARRHATDAADAFREARSAYARDIADARETEADQIAEDILALASGRP